MEYFSIPQCNAFVVNLQWQHLFVFVFVFIPTSLQFKLPTTQTSLYSKPSQTWDGWRWCRKQERNGKACNLWWLPSLSCYTALSFDTTTYLRLLQHFPFENRETNRNSVYCAGKTNLHCWVHLEWTIIHWHIYYPQPTLREEVKFRCVTKAQSFWKFQVFVDIMQ